MFLSAFMFCFEVYILLEYVCLPYSIPNLKSEEEHQETTSNQSHKSDKDTNDNNNTNGFSSSSHRLK